MQVSSVYICEQQVELESNDGVSVVDVNLRQSGERVVGSVVDCYHCAELMKRLPVASHCECVL